MKNIIIGTAGHVDHGKTALIKALTGTDTDRLKEEKKRGITIELGFAHLDLGDGLSAGVVDVPGHERFIKNMLAGAGGIDLALLIVAADDGVMPQTREHLDILSLLSVREGIIALTKSDLADEDLRELVAEDIRESVRGTFLENAPIVPVSSHTGEGIDSLRREIAACAARASEKNTALPFRLPIDRVFTMEGFGTVVTGTMVEGELREGDEAQVYPGENVARVRSIQVHSKSVKTAFAGQRVAVNLSGVKKEELDRGDTLAAPRSMERTLMLDVRLDILKNSPREIANGTRLHFYHGSRETLCKLALLGEDRLSPGMSGFAQLRFSEPVAVKRGDRFIVRFYSPVETVGGGVVLDAAPQKHRRKAKAVLDALTLREKGGARDNLLQTITDLSPVFAAISEVRARLGISESELDGHIAELEEHGDVFMLTKKCAVSAAFLAKLASSARAALEQYHAANPLQPGMRRDQLRTKVLAGRQTDLADKALSLACERGNIRLDDVLAALPDFKITYSEKDKRLSDAVEKLYVESGFSPPDLDDVFARFEKDKAALKLVIDAQLQDGRLVLASPQIYFSGLAVEKAVEIIGKITADKGQVTLADFRDAAQTSRKYALALLEYFDRKGVTKKVGDARVPLRSQEKS